MWSKRLRRRLASAAAFPASVVALAVPPPPPVFVDVARHDPRIVVGVRYAGAENFTGRPVPGYGAPVALLSVPAAEALKKAQDLVGTDGYRLVVYDAYRPARAVRAFVAWAAEPSDADSKRRYYPFVAKSQVVALGYVSDRSRHSSGSTVDVGLLPARGRLGPPVSRPRRLLDGRTIAFLDDGTLDMGTS